MLFFKMSVTYNLLSNVRILLCLLFYDIFIKNFLSVSGHKIKNRKFLQYWNHMLHTLNQLLFPFPIFIQVVNAHGGNKTLQKGL